MKLLSEYYSDDMKRNAKVFYEGVENYRVVYTDEFGNTFAVSSKSLTLAEDIAEDRVQ